MFFESTLCWINWRSCKDCFKNECLSGPVIQANRRLTFEDYLRSGGLLCFTTQWTSVHTGLADSMVTLGETRGWLGVERWQFCLQDTSHSAKWHRQAALVHCISLCVKYCRVVDSVPRWRLSPTNWPIQSDHLLITDWWYPLWGGNINMFIPGKHVHDCGKIYIKELFIHFPSSHQPLC